MNSALWTDTMARHVIQRLSFNSMNQGQSAVGDVAGNMYSTE
jgi:hypothetical protein